MLYSINDSVATSAFAVPSIFNPALYPDQTAWAEAVRQSSVRLQWDPDHDPSGAKVERRAIQLGLRGELLRQFAEEWIIEIDDISTFVANQRSAVLAKEYTALQTPQERVYLGSVE